MDMVNSSKQIFKFLKILVKVILVINPIIFLLIAMVIKQPQKLNGTWNKDKEIFEQRCDMTEMQCTFSKNFNSVKYSDLQ